MQVAVSTPAEVTASSSPHRRRWPVQLAAAVCVALVVAVLQGPFTTFAWRVQLQFWPVIEQMSYGEGPNSGGLSFSVTVRPDATRQDLEDLIDTVDEGWWHTFRSERDEGEVIANGVAFCRHADHAEDRLRLREALRAIRASLTTKWACNGYPLPNPQGFPFADFAEDTVTVARALEAVAETGPVMIADDTDWARLSRTLPPVVDAVQAITPIERANLTTDSVTLTVQPTQRLDEANRAATAATQGRIAVTVRND
ncbi:MAG: hypothetical protein IT193_11860 [Propionibacteriaceae bacterium]|nr:hypothetical protein [Propionibacteriaceae bacterium]